MEELMNLLKEPYSRDNWLRIVESTFANVAITEPTDIPYDEDLQDKIESFRQFGTVTLADGNRLPLIELRVTERIRLRQNRVQLRQLIARLIDQDTAHGVLAVFDTGEDNYRFSFTAKESDITEEGEFVETETDKKRFTYVLGRNEQTRTAAEQFARLSEKGDAVTIKDVVAAFNVEPLTKEFFDRYKKYYEDFVEYITGKRFEKVKGKWKEIKKGEPSPLHEQVFSSNDKNARNYVKLLLGRLVFIKFLQKKAWMGVEAQQSGWQNGDPDFLFKLYNDFQQKENFHSGALLPLFDHLNAHGDSDVFAITNTKVPALNGGLFERQYENLDILEFEQNLFSEFLEFLEQYNFTIDESDPDDTEIGIDPEMLGHIFENLLEDNKDKGAFYTPKPIVKYMCQESIIEYLYTWFEKNNLLDSEEENVLLKSNIERFIKKHEGSAINDHEKTIARALKQVKICDPAIGSGAFPMGILLEIFSAVNLLYDHFTDSTSEVWELNKWNPARIKEHIIQNSIYGVDIEKGAVDIARLRFWLSLIIDEEEPRYLPNLDYKIVVGNSLLPKFNNKIIEIDWTPRKSLQGRALEQHTAVQNHLREVVDAQRNYFSANNEQKEVIKQQIRTAKLQLIKSQTLFNKERFILSNEILEDDSGLNTKKQKENQAKKAQLEQFDETAQYIDTLIAENNLPFGHFDWKLDFPEILNPNLNDNPGFDIVIGNPPYGSNIISDEKKYFKEFRSYEGNFEVYVFFIDYGLSLLNELGTISYITPDTWIAIPQARNLRAVVLDNCSVKNITQFSVNVFESANVNNILFVLRNTKEDRGLTKIIKCNNPKIIERENGKKFIEQNIWKLDKKLIINIRLTNQGLEVKNKLEFDSNPGIEFLDVSQGIIPYSKENHSKEILENKGFHSNIKEDESFGRWVQGRVIKRYRIEFEKEEYLKYGKFLHRPRKPKYFSNERILVQEITGGNPPRINATIYDDVLYHDPGIISCLNISKIDIHCLLGIINSALMSWYHTNCSPIGERNQFPKVLIGDIRSFPFKKTIGKNIQSEIVNLVKQTLQAKLEDKDTSELETLLDTLVFKLYKLTFEEAKLVYPSFTLTEAEYNAIELPEESKNIEQETQPGIGLFAEGTLFDNPDNT